MTTFSIGGATVYAYGLTLALGAALCLLLTGLRMKKRNLAGDTISVFAVLSIPLCILCSRALYCLVRLPWFMTKGLGYFFAFRDGGFFLFGSLLGGFLAAWLTGKLTRQNWGLVADSAAAPASLLVAIARLAEGLFAGQGYGWGISDWFSVEAFDPEEYTGMSLFHLEDASFFERFPFATEDAMYGEWHWAVFVIEALIALVIFLLLWRLKDRRPGWIALAFLTDTCAMQVLGESLRQDAVLRWGFVRAGQIAAAIILAGILIFLCLQVKGQTKAKILSWTGVLLGMGVVMAMEFALEKKIVFLEAMPMDVCYVVMTLACIGIALTVRSLRRLAPGD